MNKKEFREYIIYDVLSGIEGITTKNLFGGYGFYIEDIIFAAYIQDSFAIKADKLLRDEIERAGGKQFVYYGHKTRGPTPMPYWFVPEEILEHKEIITDWAHRSWEACRS